MKLGLNRGGVVVAYNLPGSGGAGGSGGVSEVLTPEALAADAANEIARQLGPLASVIVLVSRDVDGHSDPAYAWRGPCLPVIGLLDVGAKLVRKDMPENYRR